jgi:SMP-30/Gluconolactonase/LRE-like region
MSLASDIVERVFFPDRDVHAIPVLDGGFSPNQRLERAETLATFEAPDCIARAADGRLYVSAGDAILTASAQSANFETFATLPAKAGGLAVAADGTVLACVDGQGVVALDTTGRIVARLTEAGGVPLSCPTDVAVAADGSVFVTDGSSHNHAEAWLVDLMQNRAGSGRVVVCDAGLTNARVLADGLSWPAGIAISHDEAEVLVTESWRHRLTAYSRKNAAARVLVKNFSGYPGRVRRGPGKDYWIAFFALRTQLTEFVLREHAFRIRMMQQVSPELWIGPTLGGRVDYREPTQIGRIKKLGIQKPWAPARSYGLVARLDGDGYAIESLHSRTSGKLHGITCAVQADSRLLAVSKGHGKLAAVALVAAN